MTNLSGKTDAPKSSGQVEEAAAEANPLTEQVLNTLSGITRQNPGVEQAEFDEAGMGGVHVDSALGPEEAAHEAFRAHEPRLAQIPAIDGILLHKREVAVVTAIDEIGTAARDFIRAGMQERQLQGSESPTLGSDFDFGDMMAPNLTPDEFGELQRVSGLARNQIADDLGARGILAQESAVVVALQNGLVYPTNPAPFIRNASANEMSLAA